MPRLPSPAARLAAADRWRYGASNHSHAEAAAWTALALAVASDAAAARPANWLASIQQPDGSVGISASQAEPRWPTSLALLAWCTIQRISVESPFTPRIRAAVQWSLADRGRTAPQSVHIGHNTELAGWSWAADTHSWLEPTCMFVLGLRAAGNGDHPRVREGERLILDRLLPAGGANYGNTIVLGQPLVPHLQPTGLAMLALAGVEVDDARIGKSLDYLEQSVPPVNAPASLAFAAMGLAAHNRPHQESSDRIYSLLDDAPHDHWRLSEYEQALLLLALQPPQRWLPPEVAESDGRVALEASA